MHAQSLEPVRGATPTRRRSTTAVLAAVAVAVALLASCSTGGASLTASRRSPERGTADSGAPGGSTELRWARCTEDPAATARLQCATLAVPLDHSEPAGGTIDLALARTRASGDPAERIGSIVFNPGGPGGSGIEFLANASMSMPAELTERFDLVSFDPRGVAASSPVRCLDDETRAEQMERDLDPSDEEDLEQAVEDHRELIAACERESGDLLPHMSTADVAADLDLIRSALGDETLTYVGFSYGTAIGATYATLYPERTRALVLDGAVSPTGGGVAAIEAQARGFENTFGRFVRACDADPACPLGPDAAARIEQVRAELEASPIEVATASGPRTLTAGLMLYGLVAAMYDTSMWGTAANAIADLRGGGAETLLTLTDRMTGREPDGTFDNSADARSMVNCADDPTRPTLQDGVSAARSIEALSPHFGELIGWSALACLDWPMPENPVPPITGAGAAPILVIGTVGDPATPYEWSEQMAQALESAQLLTYEGTGHTAFLRGGECVEDAVVAFLVDITLPEPGTRCPAVVDEVGFGGLRDVVIEQFVDTGLPEAVARCIVDGLIEELGLPQFERMLLTDDVEGLTPKMTQHALRCRGGG